MIPVAGSDIKQGGGRRMNRAGVRKVKNLGNADFQGKLEKKSLENGPNSSDLKDRCMIVPPEIGDFIVLRVLPAIRNKTLIDS
jgi:hypothetical protein